MLKDMLNAELVKRQTEASEKAAIEAERKSLNDGLQAALRDLLPELAGLKMRWDYGQKRNLVEQFERGMKGGHSFTLYLPGNDGRLELNISARTSTSPPIARLQHCRSYPFKSDPAIEFPGHTPPAELVRRLMEQVVPYIVMEV